MKHKTPIGQMPYKAWERFLYIGIKSAQRFCLLPVYWDEGSNSLKIAGRGVQLGVYMTFFTLILADSTYQMVTICTLSNYQTMSVDDSLKLLLHGISRATACGLILGYLVKLKETIVLYNQLHGFHHKLKGLYYGDPEKIIDDGVFGYMAFGVITMHIQPLGPILQHLQERQAIRYWGSRFLPGEVYNSALGVIGFSIVEMILSYFAVFGAGYVATQLVVYTQTTRHWLRMIMKESRTDNGYIKIWINLKNIRLYRTLLVLNRVHNDACAPILWPLMQYLLCTVHVIVNVLTIKCFLVLPLMIKSILILSSFAIAFFESTCLKSAANIYEIAQEYKTNICRDRSKKNRVMGRSLRCLRIEVGSYYYIKISTFTTFMRTVIEYTINVLLTLRSM